MQHRRQTHARVGIAVMSSLTLALGVACGNGGGQAAGSTPAPTARAAQAAPTVETTPTTAPAPAVQPTPDAAAAAAAATQQPFGLHSPLPLSGEYAVTANLGDHSLSVVPIGAATVAETVSLDLAPRALGTAPNSDTVVASDGSADGHVLAIASLNAGSESGTIDAGSRVNQIASPPPNGATSPLLIVNDSDNTLRPFDPSSQTLGAPVPLGEGPHTVSVARGNSMLTPQVYVANAGDGTITVLDAQATAVQSTMQVGGTAGRRGQDDRRADLGRRWRLGQRRHVRFVWRTAAANPDRRSAPE